ncbi:Predicted arabinose efflux permease, MFS family [Filomicrobium insigne]|uniref:Predicted arabinose efflux permease, MFS family n=1 Tax=Filomicrobium insigne TaxID=418854 RepID=A0A1H0H8R2_9HYPH|nr:MFS transporter [Filomicrobium insigne]SDO15527.1 Predicted arabinose efflux permease, MFS family [Filomicrobium insigne]
MDAKKTTESAKAPSAWAPLARPAFAVLWTATIVSNIGTWMHDVGAGWLMTDLSPSPLVVAAVQAATTLPVFLFALPAGALADIVDRRKLLLIVNAILGVVAGILAFLVSFGMVTPTLLLLITFIMGTGAAFMAPAWQAVVPQLVPRQELTAAIALNSMGINVSRAIGPALAGFLIVAYGLATPFFINALSVVGIIAALLWWRQPRIAESQLPPEQVGSAIVAGLRYALNSRPVAWTLIRALGFFIFASAFWALIPLIVRNVLKGGPTLYGILLGCLGAGAVAGAVALPKLKARFGPDITVAAGSIGTAAVLAILSFTDNPILAAIACGLAGVSWIAVLSSLQVSAQTALPNWVRARGLSIFLTVFFGAMSGGSLIWGKVATLVGIPTTLLVAAAGALLMIPLTWRAKLNRGETLDLTPSMHWPQPLVSDEATHDRGPVMIQVTYEIAEKDRANFITLMNELSAARRRGGGYGWTLMQDAADPSRFVETWCEVSWLYHLRHHERVTGADHAVQDRILALHRGSDPPVVTHLIRA